MHRSRIAALATAGLLGLGSVGLAACSDEDGDDGTTDEEIQEFEDTVTSIGEEIEDTVTSIGDEIQEEIDAQDEGDNEDE